MHGQDEAATQVVSLLQFHLFRAWVVLEEVFSYCSKLFHLAFWVELLLETSSGY